MLRFTPLPVFNPLTLAGHGPPAGTIFPKRWENESKRSFIRSNTLPIAVMGCYLIEAEFRASASSKCCAFYWARCGVGGENSPFSCCYCLQSRVNINSLGNSFIAGDQGPRLRAKPINQLAPKAKSPNGGSRDETATNSRNLYARRNQ